ncbi:MAG: hypothetical protein ABSF54_23935, partial [Bryobacteraceae bacterium]
LPQEAIAHLAIAHRGNASRTPSGATATSPRARGIDTLIRLPWEDTNAVFMGSSVAVWGRTRVSEESRDDNGN